MLFTFINLSKAMFIHPTTDYDILVHLDASVLPRYFHNITVDPDKLSRRGKYANLLKEGQTSGVRPGFDPARFLFNDLQVRAPCNELCYTC